jgi:hypothetical protein
MSMLRRRLRAPVPATVLLLSSLACLASVSRGGRSDASGMASFA